MAELKTQKTLVNVDSFVASIEDPVKRTDCQTLVKLMQKMTGKKPKMWGSAIVGFGDYHYKYASGREGDFFRTGFSPRKQNLTLYIISGFGAYDDLMQNLGKHKIGKSCLYVKKLADIDLGVLKELIAQSLQYMEEKYGIDKP